MKPGFFLRESVLHIHNLFAVQKGTAMFIAPPGLVLTSERQTIMDRLAERIWFRNTTPWIQKELAALPMEGRENHDGFLADLAARPETMGGITVFRLEKLVRGNFAVLPIFKVRNENGTEFTYEYVSWRYGPMSGAKGLVFVRKGGELTHFIVLRGEKFATGRLEWDVTGGFMDVNESGVKTALDRFAVEIQEELGLPDLRIDEVIDFGPHRVDAGMTNNNPNLFAAIINGSEAEKISDRPHNPDEFELRVGPVVIPMSQLPEMVKQITDGYFRSLVALSAAHGLLSIGLARA